MPLFSYKALSQTGGELTGTMDAKSRAAVIDWLLSRGHTPLSVEEASKGARAAQRSGSSASFSAPERIRVTRELASLLKAGVSLERSLMIVAQIVTRPAAQRVVLDVVEKLRGGQSLSGAMALFPHAFPSEYIGLVAAGEASGTLARNLERLAGTLERRHMIEERVQSALLYPAVLLFMIGATFTLLFTVVLPRLKPLFAEAGASLPLPTKIVLALADWVDRFGWLGLGALVVVSLILLEMSRISWVRIAFDRFLLVFPPLLGLVQKSETASFSRSLGTLLEAGVSMPPALARTQLAMRNRAMQAAIGTTLKSVREGKKLSSALAQTKVLPRASLELIRVGEEIAALPEMLLRTSDLYEREVETAVDRLVSLLVPVLTITMGLLVGGIVASVLVGIMSLNNLAF